MSGGPSQPADPLCWTLCEAAEAIRSRRISSQELTAASLQRAQQTQPTLNAFLSIRSEEAMAEAAASDVALASGAAVGALHGVPLAHKDMFYWPGRVVTCGSRIRAGFRPDTRATVLERLFAAGSVTTGSLNMAEFALGATGHNVHFGRCGNPWSAVHISGGSSSGSGAAVAARAVFAALGSDTGGSVRIPAACCGVVGLKPTTGLVSRAGIMGLSESLDCVGPLARSTRDVARLLDVMAGADPLDPSTAVAPADTGGHEAAVCAALQTGTEGLVLGLPTSYYTEDVPDEIAGVLDAARTVLESAGIRFRPVELPGHGDLEELANLLFSAEAASLHLQWLRTRPHDYGPQTFARLAQGLTVPAVSYLRARQLRARFLEAMLAGPLAACDALMVPAMRRTVPRADEVDVGAEGSMIPVIAELARFSRPVSLLGLPALTMPAGFDREGLPIALQLIGRPFGERRLLAAAALHERETDWLRRPPPLAASPNGTGGGEMKGLGET
jgi:aspartyl-tRNA(Asn)/glutamyl-tRNA(Gln) amidotransferase subunit A